MMLLSPDAGMLHGIHQRNVRRGDISTLETHEKKKMLLQDFQSRFPASSQSICAVVNTSKEVYDIVFP